jgi:polygalacturonase
MSGGVKNVYAENCRLSEVKYGGIRIKSAMGRGGYVYNITFHKITISNTIKGPTI